MTRHQKRYSRRNFLQALAGHGAPTPDVGSPITFDQPIITHVGRFYRQPGRLGQPPQLDRHVWNLVIGGAVMSEVTLTHGDIMARAAVGDMRTLVNDNHRPGGEAVGNAVWRGCLLSELLREVGVLTQARYIQFEGADGYTTTLPLAYVMEQDVLLAWSMNGAQLPPEHGFPLRALVPGLYGAASTRWLTRITLLGELPRSRQEPLTLPLVRTFAQIMTPQPYAQLSLGTPVAIQGIAFAGGRPISQVEISVDGGPWTPSTLRPSESPHAWTQWYTLWTPELVGGVTLAVRALDDQDNRQGAEPVHILSVEIVPNI